MLAEQKQQTTNYKECTIDEQLGGKGWMREKSRGKSERDERQESEVRKRTNARMKSVEKKEGSELPESARSPSDDQSTEKVSRSREG
jgi:hypothetical protein